MLFDFDFNYVIEIIECIRQRENNLSSYAKRFIQRLTRNKSIF